MTLTLTCPDAPPRPARPRVRISAGPSDAELVRSLERQLRLTPTAGHREAGGWSEPAGDGAARASGAGDPLTPDQQLRLQAEVTRNMAEGVLIVRTSDWTIVHANPKLAELFGYGLGELEGRAVETLTPPSAACAGSPHAPVQTALRACGRFSGEIENVRKDGTVFWSQVNISNVEHPVHGEVSVAVHADITAQKTARDDLANAEERFRRAFEDAGAGMALMGVTAPDVGRFLQVNRALADITGLSQEELRNRGLEDLLHPDDAPGGMAADPRPLGDDVPAERRLLDASGRVVWVLLSTSLVCDAAGVPLHRMLHVRDISDRKRFEGQLQRMADHDPLTGLYNRRRFEDELVLALAAAERYGRGGAVLAVDLDHFKFINEAFGHTAGDALIVRVGRLLQGCLRSSDIVARVGGDAFAVVLPHADEREARRVAGLLLDVVRSGRTEETPGARRMSVSVGIALFDAEAGAGRLSGEALLMQADIAMNEAKQAGRDQMATFDASSGRQAEMRAHLTWAERLRDALDDDAFVLHAQPIVGLDADGPGAYELLLRLHDVPGPPILPGAFLHVAERTNLIVDIDLWVLRRAVALLAENEREGRDVRLHVNVSARSVNDPDMADAVVRELTGAGVDPSRLVFEVTETVAIVNLERARSFASRLHALGCRVALDDFGAGFASFVYLKELDFSVLKIDGELIRDLSGSLTDQLLVKAIVEMARGLGKVTIAEYVEDEQTVELLRGWGVDFVQGFHIGLPAALGTYMDNEATGRAA